ncbi:MAG: DUF2029 domain-containing protein [Acidobacteria bacterium]|nr:DUF2029 domain-containing protein [Acidobacteriota bacterium]
MKADLAAILRNWWADHGTRVLRVAVMLMAIAAFLRLTFKFYLLVWEPGFIGANDLKLRHTEVHGWFAGRPVYEELAPYANYPPASYALLWPFLGWLPVPLARWLWAATTVVMLGWFVSLLLRESTARTPLERTFVALLPLSTYATSSAIGNGQLIVYILPALIAGLTLLRRQGGWHQDMLGAVLFVVALVSPTIVSPFFWVLLFVPGRMRPAMLVVLSYGLLTLFATWFQKAPPLSVIGDWLEHGRQLAVAEGWGYANLHSWLAAFGLQAWNLPASLLVLGALGVWVYRHRRIDLWLLLAVSAVVARIWTYHRLYNDLLILFPMIACFRIAKRGPAADGGDWSPVSCWQ